MKRYSIVYSLVFILSAFNCYSQSIFTESILWSDSKIINNNDSVEYLFSFENAFYDLEQHNYPIFRKKIRLPENVKDVNVKIEELQTIPLTTKDNTMLSTRRPKELLSTQITYERKIPYAIISYIPITNEYKVSDFNCELNLTYGADFNIDGKKQEVENSVLSSGDWYRIKISNEGLYRLDKSFFEEMGISTSEINPKKIQVYGNGGAMLPEANSIFRYRDLEECSIYVKGEEDGAFNSNDFVVFYAQSPHRWEWDTTDLVFQHILNIYDNHNYYYVHIGEEDGKRIESVQQNTNENFEVDYYTNYQFYEWENQNLKHTGRQWFGEYFSFNEQYDFNFNFQNRIKTEPVTINARAVARSASQSHLRIKHNGQEVLNVPIGVGINSEIYVDDGEASSEFISNDNVIDLALTYDKNGNSAAFAYLDYVELQAKCELKYSGNQLMFREPSTVADDRITKFLVNSNLSSYYVWDVTNPIHVENIILNNTTDFIVQTDALKTFVLHDLNKSTYQVPIFDQKIDNQNLHAQEPTDLIIITADDFLDAALSLADFHRQNDGITVNVVTTEQIYNEFSSGKQDLMALRDYVKMLYDKADTEEEIPENVLLFGDASFDYKGITASNGLYNDVNFVPTYQSEYSFKVGPSYCTDDFIAFLDDNEGAQNTMDTDGMDIGVGRIVCQTITEANAVVEKIKNYNSVNSLGDWRTNICFVADDVDDESWEFRLQENIDKIAQSIDTSYHNYNINKIYLDAYQQVSSSGGQRYPDARRAIVESVSKGTLMMHYYGHGGEVGWAEERVLELIDINEWDNLDKLAVFITATCEFSRYDDAKRVSAGEQILLNPNGAGIALFTTTRTITESDAKNLSSTYYKYAIPESSGSHLTFGTIMRSIKNDLNSSGISSLNKLKFTLLGDPALKFPIPKWKVVVDEILDADAFEQIDSIHALSKVVVRGSVTDELGVIINSFDGLVKAKVYDKPSQLQTFNNDYEFLEPFHFELQQNVLYSGNVSVQDGTFEFEFVVPKDIAYFNGNGKISLYAQDSITDAVGANVEVVIGGFNENAELDVDGPEIELFMNDVSFMAGGVTNSSPSLFAQVKDDSGINTTGNGIGHDIVAVLDEDSQNSIVLNHYYESDLDSYQSGTVRYPFANLEEGLHDLKIKVWDVYNNSSEAFTEFLVVENEELILSNLMNYPNPFTDFTRFHFEHNRSEDELNVRLDIYDMNGAKVKSMQKIIQEGAFSNSEFTWDGTSDGNYPLKSGMYICKLSLIVENTKEENTISSQLILIK